MANIVIKQTTETDSGWEFIISAEGRDFTVTLSQDYYQQLTGGAAEPDELVIKSFEFLLQNEPVGSILPEFDLPLIGQYFPEYETEIAKRL